MKKYVLVICLIFPVVCLALVVLFIQAELNAENTVVVKMRGFDPFDLIAGHYLYLEPDWVATDCSQFADNRCPTEKFARYYRYYLPEKTAVDLDKHVSCPNTKVEMVFTWRGHAKPLVKNLLINSLPWQEWKENGLPCS